MKKNLLTIALIATAFSASATTIGLDYGYTRSTDGRYTAGHTTIASIKQGLGKFGNVKLIGGAVQVVTNTRDNGNLFGVEYSYDFTTSLGALSPEVGVLRTTGLVNPTDTATLGATLRTPLNVTGSRLVTAIKHTEDLGSDKPGRTTTALIGMEYDVTKALTLKAGYAYTRLHTVERNANGITAGAEFKF